MAETDPWAFPEGEEPPTLDETTADILTANEQLGEALIAARAEIVHLASDRDSRAVDVDDLRHRLTAVRGSLHAARADRDAVATRLTVVEDMHRQHMEVCPTRDDHAAARRNAAEVDRLHALIDRILDGSAYTHAQQVEWRREARQ